MEVDPAPQVGTGEISGLLGIDESELDDLKSAAKPALLPGQLPRSKRPKLKNTDFFDDDRGFKKLIKTFPNLKFRGKGCEFQDLSLLLGQYETWLKDLYPIDEHFENMVWKARSVLMDREISDEGEVSDPRERLHMLRYEYKRAGGAGTKAAQERMRAERERAEEEAKSGSKISDEARQRMEANRQRALEKQRQRQQEASQGGADAAASTAAPASTAADDVKLRIEANRLRALEKKRQREEEEAMRAELAAQAEMEAMFAEQDAGPAAAAPAAPQQAAARAPVRTSFDMDDEDPFGWGGGFDDPFESAMPPPQAAPAAAAPPSTAAPAAPAQPPPMAFEEEEDPFGLGCGFD